MNIFLNSMPFIWKGREWSQIRRRKKRRFIQIFLPLTGNKIEGRDDYRECENKGKEESKGRKTTGKRAKLEGEKDRKVQKEKRNTKQRESKREEEEEREE
jgi:hypothetical protein